MSFGSQMSKGDAQTLRYVYLPAIIDKNVKNQGGWSPDVRQSIVIPAFDGDIFNELYGDGIREFSSM